MRLKDCFWSREVANFRQTDVEIQDVFPELLSGIPDSNDVVLRELGLVFFINRQLIPQPTIRIPKFHHMLGCVERTDSLPFQRYRLQIGCCPFLDLAVGV